MTTSTTAYTSVTLGSRGCLYRQRGATCSFCSWWTAWRKAKAWMLRLVSTWVTRGRICWHR
eukprot:3713013-Prymnesium_polylepis.1